VPTEPINTVPLQNFINQVKAADLGNQRELRLDLITAKNVSYSISILLARLAGNYEDLLKKTAQKEEVVTVNMDGGDWSKNNSDK